MTVSGIGCCPNSALPISTWRRWFICSLFALVCLLAIAHVIGRDQSRIGYWNTTINWSQFEAPFCLVDRTGFWRLSCIQGVFIDDLSKEINLHKFKVIWRGVPLRVFDSADGFRTDLEYHSPVFRKAEARGHTFEPLRLIIGTGGQMGCMAENYHICKTPNEFRWRLTDIYRVESVKISFIRSRPNYNPCALGVNDGLGIQQRKIGGMFSSFGVFLSGAGSSQSYYIVPAHQISLSAHMSSLLLYFARQPVQSLFVFAHHAKLKNADYYECQSKNRKHPGIASYFLVGIVMIVSVFACSNWGFDLYYHRRRRFLAILVVLLGGSIWVGGWGLLCYEDPFWRRVWSSHSDCSEYNQNYQNSQHGGNLSQLSANGGDQ